MEKAEGQLNEIRQENIRQENITSQRYGLMKKDNRGLNLGTSSRTKNSNLKKRTVISLLVLVSVILAACSSSSKTSTSATSSGSAKGTSSSVASNSGSVKSGGTQNRIILADENTIKAATVAINYTGNVKTSTSVGQSTVSENLTLNGTGNLDLKNSYFSLNVNMTLNSSVSTGTSTSFPIKVILSKNEIYMSSSILDELSGGSANQWYSMNNANSSGFLNSNTASQELENPAIFLKAIESYGQILSTGSVTVGGVSYDQYKVTINLAKAIEATNPAAASKIGNCINSSYTLPLTILVNSNNTIHSISMTMNMANLFNSTVGSAMSKLNAIYNLTLTFSNYGQTFSETIPSSTKPFPVPAGSTTVAGVCS